MLRTLFYVLVAFFKDTNRISMIIIKSPNNWSRVSDTYIKIVAKIMVKTAPIPATIAKFRQLTLFIEDVTRKEVQYRIKKKTTYAKSKTLLTSTS